MDTTDNPREMIIHQSANRPNQLLGGDRELVLVMIMIAGGLAFSLASWCGIGLAVVLWIVHSGLAADGQGRPTSSAGIPAAHKVYRLLRGKKWFARQNSRNTPELEIAMQITEHRSRARGLADLLLPFALIEDGILLQQDGSLLAGWSYRGPDMHSATHSEMSALTMRLNSILRLGSGWMLNADLIRSRAPGYPEQGHFPQTVTRLIDDERRQQFMDEGAHYESEYFLSLTYLPPIEAEERVKGWMFEGRTQIGSGAAHQVLERFKSRIELFENVFSALFRVERLKRHHFDDDCGFPCIQDGLLRYYRRCVAGGDHAFTFPEIPVYLNELLATQDFCAGIEPRIGSKHIRVIALDGFPKSSFPGV